MCIFSCFDQVRRIVELLYSIINGKEMVISWSWILKPFYDTCWNWNVVAFVLIRNCHDLLNSSVCTEFIIHFLSKNFHSPLILWEIFNIEWHGNLRGFSSHCVTDCLWKWMHKALWRNWSVESLVRTVWKLAQEPNSIASQGSRIPLGLFVYYYMPPKIWNSICQRDQ